MRKYSLVKKENDEVKKVMIYNTKDGCYLFFYEKTDSIFGNGDYWFESLQDAEEYCKEAYDISHEDWILLDDPLPYSQHDTFKQIRIVGRDVGTPQWGKFEVFIDNKWIPYKK